MCIIIFFFFFFSSRRRHTRWTGDWSSDVCSSDLQSLELTLGKDAKFIRAFDAFRKKRNVSSYDIGGGISHREVEEMIGIAQSLQQDVEQWIRTNHASLL